MATKLRKGDQIVVIAGNDKGKTGKILYLLPNKIIVEGVNVRKKHMKKTQENQQGQIIDVERPIHISNVMFSKNDEGKKLRTRVNKDGNRELYFLKDKKQVLHRAVNK